MRFPYVYVDLIVADDLARVRDVLNSRAQQNLRFG
jgi:hypothetical protein